MATREPLDESDWRQLKRVVRRRVVLDRRLEEFTEPRIGRGGMSRQRHEERLRQKLHETILKELRDQKAFRLPSEHKERLVEEVAGELLSLGPIALVMEDSTVSEVMINGSDRVFVERGGKIEETSIRYQDNEHLLYCIERMLDGVRATVSESEPFADALMPDGSRVNVIIPPLSLDGPIVTIRKELPKIQLPDMVANGTMTQQVSDFLAACVQAHINVVISGGTSTGKTTLITSLSTHLSPSERVITIENVAELQLAHPRHWIRLIARPPNVEGRGEITVRQLVKNALRMRPDRIILGESRGAEALDMIQAMHTGHEGFFNVIHANSPMAALERLEILMMMSQLDLEPRTCRLQVASAIELVVHITRFPDGGRRIERISQVTGVSDHGYHIDDLFAFHIRDTSEDGAIVGALEPTGSNMTFAHKFARYDIPEPTLTISA